MPKIRNSIVLIDDLLTKSNTVRNALMRDKASKSYASWSEITGLLLNFRQAYIEEMKLGPLTKLDVAMIAVKDRYATEPNKSETINTNLHRIWSAKTMNEARKISLSCGWDEDKFKIIVKKKPAKYGEYTIEQFKVVSKQPDYRPPVIEDEEQDDNSTNDSENGNNSNESVIDPELQRLIDGK